jgi:hypothetical protein
MHPSNELVVRFRWSVTQIVVLVIGIFLMAIGGIGLARAGAEGFSSLLDPEVVVAWWHRTPLMSVLEIIAGLLLVVEGAQPKGDRVAIRIAGSLALVFGFVATAAPSIFDSALGAGRASGGLYGFIGVVLLGVGFGSPIERESVQPLDGNEDEDGYRPGRWSPEP